MKAALKIDNPVHEPRAPLSFAQLKALQGNPMFEAMLKAAQANIDMVMSAIPGKGGFKVGPHEPDVYSAEPHGPDGQWALYSGRSQWHHGLRLCNITEVDPKDPNLPRRIAWALNEALANPIEKGIPTLASQVRDFQAMMGRPWPESPCVPDADTVRSRLTLIAEKFFELLTSAGINTGTTQESVMMWIEAGGTVDEDDDSDKIDVDLPAFVHALADINYAIEGTRQEFGVDGAPIAAVVHEAHMAKQKDTADSMPLIAEDLRKQGWAK